MLDESTFLSRIFGKFNALIWDKNVSSAPIWKRFLYGTIRITIAVGRDLKEGQLSLRAMSLVYTTVISLVPLLAISFSVLKGFGAHNEIKPALLNLLEPLGEKRIEITDKIVSFVDNIQVGILGAVGLALLLYSVIAMMQKIERSFNYTWHIHKSRPFSQRFSDYLSVLSVGPLLIFLSVGITTSISTNTVVEFLAAMPILGTLLEIIGLIVPYLMMAAAFAFIYFFMPNTKVNIGSAFIGGLATAVVWKTMGWVVASFVATSASHTLVYSAFASIIIFMIWLYLGWLVLLVGASIAFYHQNPQYQRVLDHELQLSGRIKEKLALAIAHLIAEHFERGEKEWNAIRLAEHFQLPINAVEKILAVLENADLFIKSSDKQPGYYPSRPIEQIRVLDVINAVRSSDEHSWLAYDKIPSASHVDSYLNKSSDLLLEQLGDLTLKTLIEREPKLKEVA